MHLPIQRRHGASSAPLASKSSSAADYLSRRTPKGAYSFGLALFACIDSNLESGRYISRVGRASRFLSLLPLDASVHQMPFYLKMYLNLLIGRIHVTSASDHDRLHEQQPEISPRNESP